MLHCWCIVFCLLFYVLSLQGIVETVGVHIVENLEWFHWEPFDKGLRGWSGCSLVGERSGTYSTSCLELTELKKRKKERKKTEMQLLEEHSSCFSYVQCLDAATGEKSFLAGPNLFIPILKKWDTVDLCCLQHWRRGTWELFFPTVKQSLASLTVISWSLACVCWHCFPQAQVSENMCVVI